MRDTNENALEAEVDTLLAAKRRISQKYLGQSGIHAVGLQRTRNAVLVYYNPKSRGDQDTVFQRIQDEVHPYTLIMVPEPPATLHLNSAQQEDNRGAV